MLTGKTIMFGRTMFTNFTISIWTCTWLCNSVSIGAFSNFQPHRHSSDCDMQFKVSGSTMNFQESTYITPTVKIQWIMLAKLKGIQWRFWPLVAPWSSVWSQTVDVIPAKGFKLLCGSNTPRTVAKGSQEGDMVNNARIRILIRVCLMFNEIGNTFGTCVGPQGFTKWAVKSARKCLPFTDSSHKMPHSQRHKQR